MHWNGVSPERRRRCIAAWGLQQHGVSIKRIARDLGISRTIVYDDLRLLALVVEQSRAIGQAHAQITWACRRDRPLDPDDVELMYVLGYYRE